MTAQAPPQHLAHTALLPWPRPPPAPAAAKIMARVSNCVLRCTAGNPWPGAHSLPNSRPFRSLVSILVLAQSAWLAWLPAGLALLGLEPRH